MKLTELTVGCSRTINLGNYESIRIEASITVNVPESLEDFHGSFQELKDTAQVQLRQLLEETYRAQNPKR